MGFVRDMLKNKEFIMSKTNDTKCKWIKHGVNCQAWLPKSWEQYDEMTNGVKC